MGCRGQFRRYLQHGRYFSCFREWYPDDGRDFFRAVDVQRIYLRSPNVHDDSGDRLHDYLFNHFALCHEVGLLISKLRTPEPI